MRTERIVVGGISIRNSFRLAARILKERRALDHPARVDGEAPDAMDIMMRH